MSFNFVEKVLNIGGSDVPSPIQFYKRGFNLTSNGTSPSWQDIILSGNTALTLANAKANGLNYVKLFGATEQRNLPSEYTQLEYIESDGASYLIVPYRVNNKTVFYCRYNEVQNGPQTANAIFGVTNSPNVSQANYGILRLTGGSSFNRMGWGDNVSGSIIDVNAPKEFGTWYEVLYNRNELYQDNVLYGTSATSNDTEWSANYDLGIFARNGSSVSMPAVVKISSVWAKENSEYKINLIPCKRNSDNVLGMYDTVSGTFFTNQGTGTFTAGAEVVPSPDNPIDIVSNNGAIKVNSQGQIYTDGTVETVEAKSKNLFNKNQEFIEGYVSAAGKYTRSTGTTNTQRSFCIECKPNTTYTLSGMTADSTWGSFEDIVVGADATVYTTNNGTITTGTNDKYLIGLAYTTDDRFDYRNTLQIEEGSTATAYEPYYYGGTANAEMLLSVGDYQDEQSVLNGSVTRNIGIKVLDGNENWVITYNHAIIKSATEVWGAVAGVGGFCTHLTVLKSGETTFAGSCRFATDFNVYDYRTAFGVNDIIQFKQYLADQYNAGTPVIVVYPLETATTETVTAQPLTTQAGTNIVEITQASIDNLGLEVSYKATI